MLDDLLGLSDDESQSHFQSDDPLAPHDDQPPPEPEPGRLDEGGEHPAFTEDTAGAQPTEEYAAAAPEDAAIHEDTAGAQPAEEYAVVADETHQNELASDEHHASVPDAYDAERDAAAAQQAEHEDWANYYDREAQWCASQGRYKDAAYYDSYADYERPNETPDSSAADYAQAAEHQGWAAHYAERADWSAAEGAKKGGDEIYFDSAAAYQDAARHELDEVSYYDSSAGSAADSTSTSVSDSSYSSSSSPDSSSGGSE